MSKPRPPRALTKYTSWLSRLHAGSRSTFRASVSRVTAPPAAGATPTSRLPSVSIVNAIDLPSGLHAGSK
jgi:hypothetical protein